MVLVRLSQIMASVTGKPESRPELSAGLQIVGRGRMTWAKKMFWLRNAPYTIGPWAHDGQLEVRIRFAEEASKAKGKEGIDPETGLPWAAAYVKKGLEGYRAPDRLSPDEYPSKIRRTMFTVDELKAELARRKK